MSCSRLSCHTDGTKDVNLRHSLAETVYLPVAELVRLWFGEAPTSGEREAIAAAARGLEARGQVSSELAPVLNARGQRRQQRVVTLTGATPDPEPPVAVDDEGDARCAHA